MIKPASVRSFAVPILAFGLGALPLEARTQDGVSANVATSARMRIDSAKMREMSPSLAATQEQLVTVSKRLNAAMTELSQTQEDLAKLRTELTIYQKIAEVLTDRVNAADARFAKHTHRYGYQGVDFTTKWFVTSGRPISKDEKKDYATVITGTPGYTGETTIPVTNK